MEELRPGEGRIDGEEARYATSVLRLRSGDSVEVFDGGGRLGQAQISSVGPGAIDVVIGPVTEQNGPPRALRVGLATPKGERADIAVEKLTELGVTQIVWLRCEHGVVDPGAGKLERHRRVALAAARQCGRASLPTLEGPEPFEAFLARTTARGFVAEPGARSGALLGDLGRDLALVVGPEGGLSRRELEAATRAGYTMLSLGPWILRVETAAIAGAALLLGL